MFLFADTVRAQSPTNIFDPAGTPAHSIFSLSMLVFSVTATIFLIVGALLLYALLRFRHRSKDPSREPAQIYGSNQIELAWTVIPILIVVMLFLTTTRVILTTESIPKPANALDVTVIGHQFWWEYRYPGFGVVTANELHVPISDSANPRPTYLKMSSADVTHSFWVPRLAGKMDLIPNRVNTMWIDPQVPGPLPGSVRTVLRNATRKDAAARLRTVPGRLHCLDQAATETRQSGLYRQPGCGRRTDRLLA